GAPEDEASRPFRGCLWVRPQDKSACDVSGGVGLVRLIHGTACYVTKPCRLWDESLARAAVRQSRASASALSRGSSTWIRVFELRRKPPSRPARVARISPMIDRAVSAG